MVACRKTSNVSKAIVTLPKSKGTAPRLSPYEDRRLGYPRLTIRQNSERLSTVWHRLPADSLTSPSIPVAVGPFMVELFTVGCLVRSPRVSAPVRSVARRTAPHVSTVERTRHNSKPMSPRDGIRHSFATPALFRTAQGSDSSIMTMDPLSMSASPEFKMKRTNPESFHRDTILRSQCCSCLRRESSRTTVVAGLLTEPPAAPAIPSRHGVTGHISQQHLS